jgi:two-component system NarL family response regulator
MDEFSAIRTVSQGEAGSICPLRVLVVDDEPHICVYLVELLRKLGVTTTWEAGTGEAALELFTLHRPDVVLLDINLPFMRGTEVLRQLIHLDPDAAVIVVTSEQSSQMIRKVGELGAVGYVLKHLPPDRFAATLAKALAQIEPQELTDQP